MGLQKLGEHLRLTKQKEALLRVLDKQNQRIKELEQKVKEEKGKTPTYSTRGQKMILLEFLGVFNTIENFKISQGDKNKILFYLVGANSKNIEKDYNSRNTLQDSTLHSMANLKFLSKFLSGIKGFERQAKEEDEKVKKLITARKTKAK